MKKHANSRAKDMAIKLYWSTRLELLADRLFEQWAELSRKEAKPFGKFCIVVSDEASKNWLKRYMLLDKRLSRVLLNVEFAMLPEFVNDWLLAQANGMSPRERRASEHPYSRDVLVWRIHRILSDADEGGELSPLLCYLKKDTKNLARRRYALSVKLARLYDDYLNSRFQMLNNWEMGLVEENVPKWQPALYRMLAQEDFGATYAKDYDKALQPEAEAKEALEHGFPRYMAIHVFDTPFMSEPTLRILEKLAEVTPITFWMFTPKADWLADTPSDREVRRSVRRRLQHGLTPDAASVEISEKYYNSPEERLFGAMASGARAVLGALFDDAPEGANPVGDSGNGNNIFSGLDIAVHRCYSPRRELEAVKDGLHQFFKTHPAARPHDAIVLCADWDTYAPIMETVFNPDTGAHGYIPVTVDKGSTGETPLTQSFKDLLTFCDRRFEVSAVFNLLSVSAIREKFGLDDKALDDLRDMVAKANIHWGADDEDVARSLELNEPNECAFTWRSGLDRLAAEMLYGFPEEEDLLVDVGDGQIHPVGHVEAERANSVAALWRFIKELRALRNELSGAKTALELKGLLNGVIDRFYDEGQEYQNELSAMRNAISKVSGRILVAGMGGLPLETKVFAIAVMEAVSGSAPGMRTPADSVLIAPLKASYAMPHKYVWICGLSEGCFPHVKYRSSFDLIGRHPSHFDSTARERDAFALLKAALGSRQALRFSFVGRDVHSNEELPSSVLLNDIQSYFRAKGVPFVEYSHPLHSYSRIYFQENNGLPDTYSRESQAIAEKLQNWRRQEQDSGVYAFKLNDDGIYEMQLDELESFCADPRGHVFRNCLGVKPQRLLDYKDEEQFEVKLSRFHREQLILTDADAERRSRIAEISVETGEAENAEMAERKINDIVFGKEQLIKLGDAEMSMAEAYASFHGMNAEEREIELGVCGGKALLLRMKFRALDINGMRYNLAYAPYGVKNARNWALARHLAFNAVGGGRIDTVIFGLNDENKIERMLIPYLRIHSKPEMHARENLARLAELACQPMPREMLDYGAFASGTKYALDKLEETVQGIISLCSQAFKLR